MNDHLNIHKYASYQEYLDTQSRTTDRKRRRKCQWASEGDINYVARLIVRRNIPSSMGLCHGTRSGNEQKWFILAFSRMGLIPHMIIGSELNPAPDHNALTYQHDFNQPRVDWEGQFGFIYSNSFDHAYNPADTIRVWSNQLAKGGVLILEHSKYHRRPSATDPVGGKEKDYIKFFADNELELVYTVLNKAADNKVIKRYFMLRPRKYAENAVDPNSTPRPLYLGGVPVDI